MNLNAPPKNDFDKCGFMDLAGSTDGHEDEDAPFMTTFVKNFNDFIKLQGIMPPILVEPYTTTISVLYNDMAENDALMVEDEDGKKKIFVECYKAMESAVFLSSS